MDPIKKVLMHITDKMENSCVLGAIRQGMIMSRCRIR
jgi:cellobiose-specific phosphotransferase system component IIC